MESLATVTKLLANVIFFFFFFFGGGGGGGGGGGNVYNQNCILY